MCDENTIEQVITSIRREYPEVDISSRIQTIHEIVTRICNASNQLFGQIPPIDIIKENLIQDDTFKLIFPFKCIFPESLSADFEQIPIPNDGSCLFHSLSNF